MNDPASDQAFVVEQDGDRAVVTRRTFSAPVDLLWRCYTEPELVKKWLLGPPGWSMPVCEMDVRPGGKYHYRWRSDEDGGEFGFVGDFVSIEPGKQIVANELPEDAPDMSPARNTIDFVADGGGSVLVMHMEFADAAACEAAVATGMTDGMGISFDGLEKLMDGLK
ncbi:MAG: SRPBCC domain-containing protein [Hyphomicrobiaceae bacterium]|nr:SRPBCC domain-containing protein [Hyphomicrobiaceae bacterium]MCC0023842.1 SRPBCC domain-containing protein [Hyphomicrobiaceae bacterium]